MTPYEVMLSESQERMLLVVRAGDEESVRDEFARWDLRCDVVGWITDSRRLVVRDGETCVADLPLRLLIDEVPLRHPPLQRPAGADAHLAHDPLALAPPWSLSETLLRLLNSPNLGSRRPVYRQYDQQVGDDTVVRPGGDAAVVRVRDTRLGIAVTTDGNARYAMLDPRRGAAIAVAEAARNLVACGASPLAVTDCMNFGNPEKPEVFWQLSEAVHGLVEACTALATPVVSGNVSLYNDTSGVSIAPTVVVGMVGRLDDVERHLTAGFAHPGDEIWLVGPAAAELGGSEYQRIAHRRCAGAPPQLDLDLEVRVQTAVLEAAGRGLLRSAHDCSDGGVAVALAECCLLGGLGATVAIEAGEADSASPAGVAAILFGESQSRFIISALTEHAPTLRELSDRHSVPLQRLGTAGGDRLLITVLDETIDVAVAEARAAHESALLEH